MNACAAHRGWSGRAPENTLAAMKLALNESYVDWLELDVQLTKDGVPVVIHDFTLNRTTSGRGKVKDRTLEQIRSLDAGRWFGPAYLGEKVPTLEEVLQLAKGRCKLNIELKTKGTLYPGIEENVLNLLEEYDMKRDVCITSFEPLALRNVRLLDSGISMGLIMDGRPADLLRRLDELDCDLLSISYKYLSEAFAATVIQSGFRIMAWTVNEEKHIRRIAAMHPDIMICTNYPDRWKQALLSGVQ
ncbi:glycerophosphodiester phosphodiesterase [Paenibacillus swuensis]|uniref:Glycerophosphodiester phosphodiesterase n=1 Tax=Paenibacillus swuensis TaxID=1178515 RepID=A0A172TNI7_9BACL|nr:glycerophosphodiester phosphodiesterase family protein [Paenibacillus swuensis]ANE48313.1 glycerophosphodiester phosphodiesterase [Paenibacillus swuensis]